MANRKYLQLLSDKQLEEVGKIKFNNDFVGDDDDWSKMFAFVVQQVPKFKPTFKPPIQ